MSWFKLKYWKRKKDGVRQLSVVGTRTHLIMRQQFDSPPNKWHYFTYNNTLHRKNLKRHLVYFHDVILLCWWPVVRRGDGIHVAALKSGEIFPTRAITSDLWLEVNIYRYLFFSAAKTTQTTDWGHKLPWLAHTNQVEQPFTAGWCEPLFSGHSTESLLVWDLGRSKRRILCDQNFCVADLLWRFGSLIITSTSFFWVSARTQLLWHSPVGYPDELGTHPNVYVSVLCSVSCPL